MKRILFLALTLLFGCSDNRFDIQGELLGKWKESNSIKQSFVLYKKDNKTIMRMIFPEKNQFSDSEVTMKEVSFNGDEKGQRIDFSEIGSFNDEYFILSKGKLLLINKENKVFAVANPL